MGPGEDFPSTLQDWLQAVDTLVTHIASPSQLAQ